MKKNFSILDQKLYIRDFFKILWFGRVKLLLIFFLINLIYLSYHHLRPTSYKLNLNITKANNFFFEKYIFANKIALKNGLSSEFTVNNNIIYKEFKSQLKTKKNIEKILLKNQYIQDSIKKFDKEKKKKKISYFANTLNLHDKKNFASISFQWNDRDEGKEIVEYILVQTLLDLKKIYENRLVNSADILQKLNSSKKKYLSKQIDNFNTLNTKFSKSDILYLENYLKKPDVLSEFEVYQMSKKYNLLKNDDHTKWINYNIPDINIESNKNIKLSLFKAVLLGFVFSLFYFFFSYEKKDFVNFNKKKTK